MLTVRWTVHVGNSQWPAAGGGHWPGSDRSL